MSVSFTELGQRLQEQHYKLVGEQGVKSTIAHALEKKTKDSQEISSHLTSWGASWLLKAAANDKQQGIPEGLSMESVQQKLADQKMQEQIAQMSAMYAGAGGDDAL